jgi:hypothetical protein
MQRRSNARADFDDEDKEEEPHLSPTEAKMVEVFNRRRQEVIQSLLLRLSSRNSDYEQCLNAHSIL